MLVLTRRQKEEIRIGDDITVTIVRVKGNAVQVGISAPREIRVIRGELPQFDTEPSNAQEPGGESIARSEPGVTGSRTRAKQMPGPLAERFNPQPRLADSLSLTL